VNERFLSKLIMILLAGLLMVTGCGPKPTNTRSKPEPQASPTSTMAAIPEVGSCHDLSFQQAVGATDPRDSVPCSAPHTSVTFHVGSLNQLRDGHLLAVDSDATQAELAELCPSKLPDFLGGRNDQLQMSQFKSVWFTPSLQQADQGSNWFRCDAVALQRDNELMLLPAQTKGILGKPGGSGFATCGSGTPGRDGFAKVACKLPHQWRAAKTVTLPDDGKYLDPGLTQMADQSCKDAASAAAGDVLKFTWGFTWPTQEQWQAGLRHGICWLPAG